MSKIFQFLGTTVTTSWSGLFPINFLVALNRLLIVNRKLAPDDKMPLYFKVKRFNQEAKPEQSKNETLKSF